MPPHALGKTEAGDPAQSFCLLDRVVERGRPKSPRIGQESVPVGGRPVAAPAAGGYHPTVALHWHQEAPPAPFPPARMRHATLPTPPHPARSLPHTAHPAHLHA